MKKSKAVTGPQMVLDVTDEERAIAKQIKDEFKKILKKLDNSVKVVIDLRDAIVKQRPSKDDLSTK